MSAIVEAPPIDTPCPKCTPGAPPHQPDRCTGHVDEEDGTIRPCRNRPRVGQRVCGSHGGRSPQAKRAAARRLAMGEAVAELSKLGRPLEIDPAEAMLEMVYEAAGNVAVLRALVQQLDQRARADAPAVEDDESGEQVDRLELGGGIAGRLDPANWKAAPHVYVTMYDEERERLVRWSKMCRDAGVEERRVQLAADRGAEIARVMTVVAGLLFERLLAAGAPSTLLDAVRGELPGLFRTAITTTLAGEQAEAS